MQVYVVNVTIDVEVLGTVAVRAKCETTAKAQLEDKIKHESGNGTSEADLQEMLNKHFDFDGFKFPGIFDDVEAAYDQDHCEVTPADLAEAFNDGRLDYEGTPFITQASFRKKMSEAGKNADSVQADEADD
jgi:hypothetical protein